MISYHIIAFVLIAVSFLLIAFIKVLKELLKNFRKKFILYQLLAMVIFALTSLLSYDGLFNGKLQINLLLLHSIFLGLGLIHLNLMHGLFKWDSEKTNTHQFFFTCIVSTLGAAAFLFVGGWIHQGNFIFNYCPVYFTFVLPFFVNQLWDKAMKIPVKIYEKWYYPVHKTATLPDSEELRNPVIVTLKLSKQPSGSPSVFKAKAPELMHFGKFFYHFINDYNARNPESPILVSKDDQHPTGWHFYIKSGFWGFTSRINPNLTIRNNRIREHSRIICERIAE